MRYLTDRKRAEGLGSAKSGTGHLIYMQRSAVGLAVLTPLFVWVFGTALGLDHAGVLAHFAKPFNAIVTGLMLVAAMMHFKAGVQAVWEDYSEGATRTWLILLTNALSYALIGTGLFALIKLAL